MDNWWCSIVRNNGNKNVCNTIFIEYSWRRVLLMAFYDIFKIFSWNKKYTILKINIQNWKYKREHLQSFFQETRSFLIRQENRIVLKFFDAAWNLKILLMFFLLVQQLNVGNFVIFFPTQSLCCHQGSISLFGTDPVLGLLTKVIDASRSEKVS